MELEIERRFLVTGDAWLTIRGTTTGGSRTELEHPIPVADAHAMPDERCEQPIIEKTRHVIDVNANPYSEW